MPGTVDDPVRLDIWQNIVEVGWPANEGDLLVLTFTFTRLGERTTATPQFLMHSLPLDTSYSPFGGSALYVSDGEPGAPSVSLPNVTEEMMQRLVMWSWHPAKVRSVLEGEGKLGAAVVFINLDLVRGMLNEEDGGIFEFFIDTPATLNRLTEMGTLYWIWDKARDSFEHNLANPTVEVDLLNPSGVRPYPWAVTTDPAVWANIVAFISGWFPNWLDPGNFGTYEEPIEIYKDDRVEWDVVAQTFRGKRAFPRNEETGSPEWTDQKLVWMAQDFAEGDSDPETEIPPLAAHTLRVQVDTENLFVIITRT